MIVGNHNLNKKLQLSQKKNLQNWVQQNYGILSEGSI